MPNEIQTDLVGRRVEAQSGFTSWPQDAGAFAEVRAVWNVDGHLKLLCNGQRGMFEIWAQHVRVVSVTRHRKSEVFP